MPKWVRRIRVRRVSSQATSATSFRTRSARNVMSSRLPRGVATTYNVPGTGTPHPALSPKGRGNGLGGLLFLLGDEDRAILVEDDFAGDDALLQARQRGQLVHHLEHDLLEHRAQAPRPGAALHRLAGHRGHRVVGELEPHLLELEVLLVLLDDRVLRLAEDADQGRLVQVVQGGDHRQAAHELGDEAVLELVLGLDQGQQLADPAVLAALDLGPEADAGPAHAALHDLVDAHKGAPADEQHVGGVHLDELLVGVLAPALGRHVGHRALEDLEQGLLHALAGDVAGDRRVLRLPRDLVDLVDVDDAPLGALHVIVRRLQQTQNNILDVLAHVAGLGQCRRVGDGEGHVEHLGEGLGEEGLAGAGGPDEEDVGLLQLHLPRFGAGLDALVVVVDRDREDLLGPLLAHHVLVEHVLDLGRLGEAPQLPALLLLPLLRDDVVAELDALVADVDGGARDQLADVVLALAAERALQRAVAFARATRHPGLPYFWTCAASAACSLTARVVGLEEMTSSTIL